MGGGKGSNGVEESKNLLAAGSTATWRLTGQLRRRSQAVDQIIITVDLVVFADEISGESRGHVWPVKSARD